MFEVNDIKRLYGRMTRNIEILDGVPDRVLSVLFVKTNLVTCIKKLVTLYHFGVILK